MVLTEPSVYTKARSGPPDTASTVLRCAWLHLVRVQVRQAPKEIACCDGASHWSPPATIAVLMDGSNHCCPGVSAVIHGKALGAIVTAAECGMACCCGIARKHLKPSMCPGFVPFDFATLAGCLLWPGYAWILHSDLWHPPSPTHLFLYRM